jgi:hypothetical protein
MGDPIELHVGEDHRVAGLLQGHLTYAGMVSESIYSIVHKREVGADYAYNLFFPVTKRDIVLAGVDCHVDSVNADRIVFSIKQEPSRQS